MSEVSLYRKYRPQKFAEVIGQEQVLGVLESTLKSGSVSHAYLFSGSRGTGKTSIARIFARELGTSPTDVYEIDAASNRGIDDIRELRDGVSTLPFESKYKVYIVDEVHMLTKEAFNALLKTLEEPPAHAIFILATTELEKVPETIISRCQSFVFKKPTHAVLAKMAHDVAKKEGFTIDQGSADLIALLGDGSFRDTHGILEKVIRSASSKKPSREEIEEITGAPKSALVHDALKAFVMRDKATALAALGHAYAAHIDAVLFSTLVLRGLRHALLLKNAPAMKAEIKKEMGEDELSFLESLVVSPTGSTETFAGLTSKTLSRLLEAHQQIAFSPMPFLPLELAAIDLSE